MKNKNLLFAALLGLLLVGCAKDEDQQLKVVDRPQHIQLRTMSGMDFVRPDVPPYTGSEIESRGVTVVAPGTNQLQAIINNAGNGETIRLLAGNHTEDATLVINHKIKLTGDPGAVLSLGGFIGVLVTGANGTQITNLTIINGSDNLIGIGVENSNQVQIKNNTIQAVGYAAIALEQANHASIMNNNINGNGACDGIDVINGDFVNIVGNTISNSGFGIWCCDRKGTCTNNNIQNSFIGIIVCKVPAGIFPLGTGTGGAEMPGNNWHVSNNSATGNVWGYLAIDGSFENTLSNNTGGGNVIEMELAGDSYIFNFFTPTSHDNTVNVGGSGMPVIDCGLNNVVHGTTPLPGPCSI